MEGISDSSETRQALSRTVSHISQENCSSKIGVNDTAVIGERIADPDVEKARALFRAVTEKGGKILVSACLAGVNCRYNCGNCLDEGIKKLVEEGKAIPVCPEQMGGLPTPRTPSEILGGNGTDVLSGHARVLTRDGEDVTSSFVKGADLALQLATGSHIMVAILKSKSPSCGVGKIYDGSFSGSVRKGDGIAATRLSEAGITVLSEETWKKL